MGSGSGKLILGKEWASCLPWGHVWSVGVNGVNMGVKGTRLDPVIKAIRTSVLTDTLESHHSDFHLIWYICLYGSVILALFIISAAGRTVQGETLMKFEESPQEGRTVD